MIRVWDNSRLGFFAFLGLAIWAGATLALRLLAGPLFASAGTNGMALLFVLSVPAMWGLVVLVKRLGRVEGPAVLPAVSVVGFVGLLLDGLAVAFFPGIYGFSERGLLMMAAWLMWAYGLCWAFAFHQSTR